MKRLSVFVLAAALLAACGSSSKSSSSTSSSTTSGGSKKAYVVLITDVGQLNDHGFNQLAFEGLKRAQKNLGVRGDVFQSPSSADYVPNLATAARKGADLVISVGFDQASRSPRSRSSSRRRISRSSTSTGTTFPESRRTSRA